MRKLIVWGMALLAGVIVIPRCSQITPAWAAGNGSSVVRGGLDEESRDKVIAAARRTLDDQVAAWNRGDIPGFMAGYVRDESLRFASGGAVRRGWQETLQRYQTRYDSPEKMGMLTFRDLEFLVINGDFAEVFGRFELKRSEAVGNATGLFTLLMQREGDQWLVLHDHTSSETP